MILEDERRSSARSTFGFKTYESPFTLRYGSDEMRQIWSQENSWIKARDVWIAVAGVQMEAGLVSRAEYQDLVDHRDEIDIETILRREMDKEDPRYTGHDIVAGISEFSDKAPLGGRILHKGLTSEDVLSNVEILLIHESLNIVEDRLKIALSGFAKRIEDHKDLVVVGFTHNQAAEPTTFGYRLARYAQDLVVDLESLRFLRGIVKGKGIKGAVGTSASFEKLLEGTEMTAEDHERKIMERLGIPAVTISGQTYPRKFTLMTVATLAFIGQSCHQFASDMKLLQASPFDEVAEPRRRGQVSSSAMAHKENPNNAENIKSLARGLIGKVVEAWINASEVTLERGLEDSAGKRSYLPEAFLAVDEILKRTDNIIRGLQVRETSIARNFRIFSPFMATETVLSHLSRGDVDRQEMHELLRGKVTLALDAVRNGDPNPLQQLLAEDEVISKYLDPEELEELFSSVRDHVGDAPERCERFLKNELYPAINGGNN